MSDAQTNPHDTRPRVNKEYEDPHYHDEELDIQSDDGPRQGRPPGNKKPLPRKLPPTRRHYED